MEDKIFLNNFRQKVINVYKMGKIINIIKYIICFLLLNFYFRIRNPIEFTHT